MARYVFLLFVGLALFLAVLFRTQFPNTSQTPASHLLSEDFLKQIYQASGQFDYGAKKAVWFNREVPLPGLDLARAITTAPSEILGITTGEKWIDIDLSSQRLRAYEGDRVVYDFPISSGLPWMPTITGEFPIWAKVRIQRMRGGSLDDGSFYDLPNVPYVQYFYKGYGLHGAYWHNDFGKPRSHGCVNLRIADAEKLYYWTNPVLNADEYTKFNIKPEASTRVVVHGVTPGNIN